MSDTNLTNLIVNYLTREELHSADFTDHGDELFVQSDHAGVSVGGVGVDALDTTNIANCITHIPQDIKLELNNGTLTLKAGSKCYLKTDTTTPSITVVSDLTTTQTTNGTYFAIYNGSALTTVLTTTYNYSSLPNTYSLPLAVITVSGGAITSINQVFNGFGYIGSTVFALPGVKGLIPGGRNNDGTLKNTTFAVNSVLTNTGTETNNKVAIRLKANEIATGDLNYDETNNYNRQTISGEIRTYAIIGYISRASGVINSLSTKTVFHAVDYSDTEYMAHQAMPSDRYINMTLGASGATYTAPADGYVGLGKSVNAANQYVDIFYSNSGVHSKGYGNNSGDWATAMLPVSKGQSYTIQYNAGGQTRYFKFVYAQGAQ